MLLTRAGDADIAYEITGDGDPLLMIMGLAADARMWMLQTPAFAASYRCITFDNRGVGSSSVPPGPYSTEQMASDALAVLDAAEVERAHVLGISLGGAIAQHVALKAPERVRSLVLAATWCAPNPYQQRLAELGRLVAGLGHEQLVRASMLWLFTPRFILRNPVMVAQVEGLALQYQPPAEAFDRQLEAVLGHDTKASLPSLRVPTLILAARRDLMVPLELSEEIASVMPDAELQVLDGGHAFNFESMDAFNGAVLGFLDRH